MRLASRHALVLLATFAVSYPNTASGTTVFVSSRDSLGANDFVDWSVVGPDLTIAPNPFSATSDGGLEVTVTLPSGNAQRLRQGLSRSWTGNFVEDDVVLYTLGDGPLEISFASPVSAVGAQIQAGPFGSFTGFIEVFDSMGSSLGEFSLAGMSDAANDGSAIFLGVSSTSRDIGSVSFTVDGNGDFGINRLSINTVPEPATGVLFGFGLVALARQGRRLRRCLA